jgi:hypothetical protein
MLLAMMMMMVKSGWRSLESNCDKLREMHFSSFEHASTWSVLNMMKWLFSLLLVEINVWMCERIFPFSYQIIMQYQKYRNWKIFLQDFPQFSLHFMHSAVWTLKTANLCHHALLMWIFRNFIAEFFINEH